MKIDLTIAILALSSGLLLAAAFPVAEIGSDQIHATLYLPDAKQGFYRSTRFDWSGVISNLEYKGHRFYGPWYDRIDAKVHDFTYEGAEVVVSPISSTMGPAEEFQPVGYDAAKPGGTFIKIGVGLLRKPDASKYDHFKEYEIVDAGKWSVKKNRDSVEFTQTLTDPVSHAGYSYKKVVRLVQGKPQMLIEHSLKNTGSGAIESDVYNHNFLVLDKQAPGPDFAVTFPFQLTAERAPTAGFGEVKGNQIRYLKTLANKDTMSTSVKGFSDNARDFDVRVENAKIGAGYRVTSNRPMSSLAMWSIRTNLSVEPYIAIKVAPGGEFTWNLTYDYYTLPAKVR